MSKWFFAILVGLIVGFLGGHEFARTSRNDAFAWATISLAAGKPGDLGRSDALRHLNKSGASLDDIDLSGASLKGMTLHSASLSRANLSDCDLFQSDLSKADLNRADLRNSSLIGITLTKASLWHANISESELAFSTPANTDLVGVQAHSVYMLSADLQGSDLSGADFTNAYLGRANLRGVNVYQVNLAGASVIWADLDGLQNWEQLVDVSGLNVFEVRNPPPGFLDWAIQHGAVSVPHKEWLALRGACDNKQKG